MYCMGCQLPLLFSNETIFNIVEAQPTSSSELRDVRGMGAKYVEKYGHWILERVRANMTAAQRMERFRMLFPS